LQSNSLNEWIAYIEQAHPDSIALGLERVEQVRRALTLELSCVVIAVAGTNGKGSTCAFLEAILLEAGYRVGCYTSPHLTRLNERFRLCGREADDEAIVHALSRVEAARGGVALTYFEYTTLACGLMFQEAALDVVILEVGMGGRLDAVNVFDADCAIVTSIDIDHAEYLGNTRELIGYEKAGVFRAERPAVFAEPDIPDSVCRHAAEVGAHLLVSGADFHVRAIESDQWTYSGPRGTRAGLPLPSLHGEYQLRNAAACIAALDELNSSVPVADKAIADGLRHTVLPGRFQRVCANPTVIVDVAHNPHAVLGLMKNIEAMPCEGRTLAVFSMLKDKDIVGVLHIAGRAFDEWLLADVDSPRAMKTADLAALMRAEGVDADISSHASTVAALSEALRRAGPADRVIVFGSFLVAGEALRFISDQARRPGAVTAP
jgi:dihydrofolate synthase / folylpolyglutamate synthase